MDSILKKAKEICVFKNDNYGAMQNEIKMMFCISKCIIPSLADMIGKLNSGYYFDVPVDEKCAAAAEYEFEKAFPRFSVDDLQQASPRPGDLFLVSLDTLRGYSSGNGNKGSSSNGNKGSSGNGNKGSLSDENDGSSSKGNKGLFRDENKGSLSDRKDGLTSDGKDGSSRSGKKGSSSNSNTGSSSADCATSSEPSRVSIAQCRGLVNKKIRSISAGNRFLKNAVKKTKVMCKTNGHSNTTEEDLTSMVKMVEETQSMLFTFMQQFADDSSSQHLIVPRDYDQRADISLYDDNDTYFNSGDSDGGA